MEIGQQDENGTLVYVEKTFQLLKNKQEPAIRKTEMIFCQICIRGLRQYIHNQREAQKK
jgi:hypothetical protein